MKFILVLIFFLNVFLLSQPSFLGSGTIDDPYQIWTKEHLLELSDSVNSNNSYLIYPPGGYGRWCTNKHFCLMQDIDTFTQSIGWKPFTGYLHGKEKKISVSISYTGLVISFIFSGITGINNTIDSLTLNGYLSGWGVSGIFRSNGSSSSITECINNTALISENPNDGIIGGITGSNSGTISHCINNSSVSGVDFVAGIATVNNWIIENCINTGKVTGTEFANNNYNGVAGIACASHIASNCINLGEITGINNISGIVGIAQYFGVGPLPKISNCINAGYIKGNKYVSSILGYMEGNIPITNCINTGVIEGEEDVGSIVGGEK